MLTLVVNHAYQPIEFVGLEKAIYLLVMKKADLLVAYDRVVRSVSLTLQVPKVVRLKRYVKLKLRDRGIYRRRDVFERDGWRCCYCGVDVTKSGATIDHVVPSSKGGATNWMNTVTSCQKCNGRKADRSPEEAGMKLLRAPTVPETRRAIRPDLQKAYDEFLAQSV